MRALLVYTAGAQQTHRSAPQTMPASLSAGATHCSGDDTPVQVRHGAQQASIAKPPVPDAQALRSIPWVHKDSLQAPVQVSKGAVPGAPGWSAAAVSSHAASEGGSAQHAHERSNAAVQGQGSELSSDGAATPRQAGDNAKTICVTLHVTEAEQHVGIEIAIARSAADAERGSGLLHINAGQNHDREEADLEDNTAMILEAPRGSARALANLRVRTSQQRVPPSHSVWQLDAAAMAGQVVVDTIVDLQQAGSSGQCSFEGLQKRALPPGTLLLGLRGHGVALQHGLPAARGGAAGAADASEEDPPDGVLALHLHPVPESAALLAFQNHNDLQQVRSTWCMQGTALQRHGWSVVRLSVLGLVCIHVHSACMVSAQSCPSLDKFAVESSSWVPFT